MPPRLRAFSALAAALLTAQPALSQSALEEVVVTAQKRTESLQDVPLSIMAMGGEALESAGIGSADDLTRVVPNLRINRQAQASATVIRMRGVGASGNSAIDPSVAPFIDGVYIPRPGAILSSFLDVANVEVLRGPQGTLFGRNATTGALQISTVAPQFDGLEGEVFAEAGNYDAYRLRGIVNVPVSDTFALRFAGMTDQHDGLYDNKLDGKDWGDRDVNVGRAAARWQPSDSIDWIVRYDYAEMGGDGILPAEVSSKNSPPDLVNRLGNAFGPLSPDIGDPFDGTVSQRLVGGLDDEQWGLSSDFNWTLSSGYHLRWIAAQRTWKNDQLDGDVIFTGVDLLTRRGLYDSDAMSQELQFISPEDALFGERMDFVAGLYYFDEDYEIGEDLNFGSAFCSALLPPAQVPACQSFPQQGATQLRFDQSAESTAAFIETRWRLSDSLELTLGGRYTEDEKRARFNQELANPFGAAVRAAETGDYDFDDDQFTYRVVLSWFLNDDMMLFANYSTGYKSGGINSSGVATPLIGQRVFDSESVDNLELGIKSTWMGGAMQLNATAYRMEIDDFQDRSFRDASFLITNAGSLRQQGLEMELKMLPTDNLSFDLSLAYLDSEFTDFKNASPLPGCAVLPPPGTPQCPNPQDNTGKRNSYSPEWELAAALEYTFDFDSGMSLVARGDWQYVDDFLAGGSDLSPQTTVDAYNLFGARLTLRGSNANWEVSAFGENLTDERYAIQYFTQVLGGALGLLDTSTGETVMRNYVSAPRTYGVSVKYLF
ncbi:TonB-dependent receptor [Parahaliea mediterranea]|uniref:TonB-dependent receptor n=1 Tax=Parahaliea mediterranea TaxID=651086 RepID=UPI000E2F175B|nr:TonB-dependent receptor [Parahaliea mediterranea]